MKAPKSVDVHDLITASEFESYIRPIGQPLVIKEWMGHWPAMEKWTFPFFKEEYGRDGIQISASIKNQSLALQVALGDFIDYILDPASSGLSRLKALLDLPHPLYTYSYKPFGNHPELLKDFQLPPFVDDWFPHFNRQFRRQHFPFQQGWILIGPRGTVSELHGDANNTITWLAQIRGRKRCILFSPEDEHVYNGAVDPLKPDLAAFPTFAEAQPYECVLEPGSMLFLPPNWWHHVVALEDSITLSYNIVNHINFGDYLAKAFGDSLPNLLPHFPGDWD